MARGMGATKLLALVALLALAAPRPSSAYPEYFHARNIATSCTEHPTRKLGGHLPPVVDKLTTITATRNGQAVRAVCPGETVELSVAFGGSTGRGVLLTVSGGAIKEANVPQCKNAIATPEGERVESLAVQWDVPCGLQGSADVKVTSGVSNVGSLLKASASFPVQALSKCPASKCAAAADDVTVAETQGQQPATATVDDVRAEQQKQAAAAAAATTTAVAKAAAAAAPAAAAGAACPPSSLGYQCSVVAADGVLVHYSNGGAQPANECTNTTRLDAAFGDASGLLHFAVESDARGWVGLGYPTTQGAMLPADAVVGGVDPSTGAPRVAAYRLTAVKKAGLKPVNGWATGLGAVRRAAAGARRAVTTVVCFSRPANASGSALKSGAALDLIWAVSERPELEGQTRQGAVKLNMLSGLPEGSAAPRDGAPSLSKLAAQIAHGALMAAAFCLVLPAGALTARHKWMFGDAKTGRISPLWFSLHHSMQLLGFACLSAGFALAMALFFRANGPGWDLHKLYAPHFLAGCGVVGMALLQVLAGMCRPSVTSARRGAWLMGHSLWGWATTLAGIGNCVLGVILMHDLKGMAWLLWLVPMGVVLGLMLLAAVVLEAAKAELQHSGRYEPKSHTLRPKRSGGATSSAGGAASKGGASSSGGRSDVESARSSSTDDDHVVA